LALAAGLGLAVAVAAGPGAAGARAAGYISFDLDPQGGSGRVSYSPQQAGGALVGSNLGVLDVKGVGTPLHDGTSITISQGALNFSTGMFSGTSPVVSPTTVGPVSPASAALNQWDFAAGGSMAITGGIAALGIAPGTPLLTGSFTGTTFVRPLPGSDLKVQGGALINVVNPVLAAYLGLPVGGSVQYVGGLSTLFAASSTAPGAFSSNGYSDGQVTTTPVPEPGALAVFTLAVGGGLALLRRRSARRAG
jgi:hypothetical protein